VPCYEGLNVERMLEMGQQYEEVRLHLPDERDIRRLPRQWIINIIYSIVGDPFRNWVKDLVRNRNDVLATKNDLMIELDPEIQKAFHNSVNISSKCNRYIHAFNMLIIFFFYTATKGRGVHILKPGSKRRRTQVDMQA